MLAPHLVFLFLNKGGHVDGRMETRDKESCHFESNHPILPSCKITDIESPGIAEKREDPERELVGREGIHRSQLTDRGGGKAIEVERCTISAIRNELHTSTSVALEQPGPAEQQGGDLCLAQERLAKREAQESCEKKTVNALKMNVKAEAEEEKVRQRVLQLKAVVSGTDVAQQQLYQEALAEKSQVHQNLLFLCFQCIWAIYCIYKTIIKECMNVYSFERLCKYLSCYPCMS